MPEKMNNMILISPVIGKNNNRDLREASRMLRRGFSDTSVRLYRYFSEVSAILQ
jgi:hypothetical protein